MRFWTPPLALTLAALVLATPPLAQVRLSAPPPFTTEAPPLGAQTSAAGALTFSRDALRSADIRVDASGGFHVAFVSLGGSAKTDHRPTIYGYCPPANPAACADPNGWHLGEVAAGWPHVRLALTPQGRPRLFLYDDRATVEGESATIYAYAECDQNCAAGSNWRVRTLGASRDPGNTDADRRPVRRFALDAQGRPRFVYYFGTRWLSGTEWEQPGYYFACDADCAGTGTWRAVRLPDSYLQGEVHDLENAALAFSPSGAPRLLFALQYGYDGNPLDLRDALVYAECASPCMSTEDWSAPRPLLFLGTGPEDRSFSAQVDDAGRLHVAVKPVDEPLHYLWCDAECMRLDRWFGYPLALTTNDGEHPALALDASHNPRIAYKDAEGGLGYAWCEGGCRTAEATWGRTLVEPEEDLMAAVPVALAPGCVEHYWFGGLRPSLALDPAGHPRFAYDGEYARRCYRDTSRPELGTFIERTWWTARFAFTPQPDGTTPTEPGAGTALTLGLAAPYPNPVRAAADLSFTLPAPADVRLTVVDLLGREVAVLAEETLPAGTHRAALDASALAAGTYVVQLRAGAAVASRRVTVVR